MVSMQARSDHIRQLRAKLTIAVLIAIMAMIGLGSMFAAQAQGPDVAVMFLVDESLSSAAIARGEKQTLFNTVRFLNGALAFACQPGQCETGVSRFSAKPTQLVPLKPVEEWDELDFLRLEIGIQDRMDQSDFPAAFEETCRQLRRLSDTGIQVLVTLTDGQVGSQASPDIAPVQRSEATNRTAFIEEIRESVEFCSKNDIRLVTVLLDPSDIGGQPGAGSGEGGGLRESYRNQERELWKTWSETSGGAMIEALVADDAPSIRNVVASLGETLGVLMPEFVMPENGKLDLGVIDPYRGSVQFEIIGLKPFRVEAESPDGRGVPADQINKSENRVSINVPLPREGQWIGNLLGPASDNLFLVRPPITNPMRLQPYLMQSVGSAEHIKMPPDGEVTLELKIIPLGGDTPVVIDGTIISGTLVSPLGVKQPVIFTPDAFADRYSSSLSSTVTRPEPGLYELLIPSQTWGDVTIEDLQQGFVLVGDPIVLDWYTQPISPTAGSPLSVTVVLANSELLAKPPELTFEWLTNGKSPVNQKEFGFETTPGQYVISLRDAPDTVGTYQLSVGLLGGINVFGEPFNASDSVMREIQLMSASEVTVVGPFEAGPSEQPSGRQLPIGVLLLILLIALVMLVILLWCLRQIVLWFIPIWYRRRSDPLAVHSGIERLTGIGWATRFLGPIRPELEKIHEERLLEIEVGQKNRAVDSSLKLLRKEQRQVCQEVIDLSTWERATGRVLDLVNGSRGEIRAIRTTAASSLFHEILDNWQDSDETTEIDLLNHLNKQGFETCFES